MSKTEHRYPRRWKQTKATYWEVAAPGEQAVHVGAQGQRTPDSEWISWDRKVDLTEEWLDKPDRLVRHPEIFDHHETPEAKLKNQISKRDAVLYLKSIIREQKARIEYLEKELENVNKHA